MWRAFDDTGRLQYPDFLETVTRLIPMYWVRALGGALYIAGMLMFAYNVYRTWKARPPKYTEVEVEVPPMIRSGQLAKKIAAALEKNAKAPEHWHRKWEGLPAMFTVLTILAVVAASAFEIIPTFALDDIPKIKTVKPYTPLELYGRDIYLSEGCYNCHSQMVRPFIDETVRYGKSGKPAEYSKPGEFIYDHPHQWGSKRTGPDLAREGGKRDELWHLRHFENPRTTSKGSVMPSYAHLLEDTIDWDVIQKRVDAMAMLGVPYEPQALANASSLAVTQADELAAKLVAQGGPTGMQDMDVIALIAYMQRLGRDIALAAPAAPATITPATPATGVK
jgi:cytochrome c oxidase cbb3-type subunit I/II